MGTPVEYPWTYNLIWKLLHNDKQIINLFASNPFEGEPPKYIRAELYRYKFAKPANIEGRWWNRKALGDWIQPLSVKDSSLIAFLKAEEWIQ